MIQESQGIADLNFTAIDFETANQFRSSACSIGITRVENGKILESFEHLIKPHPYFFLPFNTYLHGIDEHYCRDAPTFGELWPKIANYIDDQIVVAHNISFDKSVLRAISERESIEVKPADFLCSMYLSKVAFPALDNHRLDTVYHHLTGKHFDQHHNARHDSIGAAEIVLTVADEWKPPKFPEMIDGLYLKGKNLRKAMRPSEMELVPRSELLKGYVICFTGKMEGFNRDEAIHFVKEHGGNSSNNLTKSTTHLVVGDFQPPFSPSYISGKMEKAIKYIEQGQDLNILEVSEFKKMMKELEQLEKNREKIN